MGVSIIGKKLFSLKDKQQAMDLEPFRTAMIIDDWGGGVTFEVDFIIDKEKNIEGKYSLYQESFGRYNERISIKSSTGNDIDLNKMKQLSMDVLNYCWSYELKMILSMYAEDVLSTLEFKQTSSFNGESYLEYDGLNCDEKLWSSFEEGRNSGDFRFRAMQAFTFGKGFQIVSFDNKLAAKDDILTHRNCESDLCLEQERE